MKDNSVGISQMAVRCMQCFISCVERTVKMINRHAYTQIALKSTNFLVSAANGMSILTSNVLRFGILSGISEMVFFFSEIVIAFLATSIGYLVFIAMNNMQAGGDLALFGFLSVLSSSQRPHFW